jgi:hydroxymethylbilane synthase
VGESTDTADVAADFAAVANGTAILFPGADNPMRSIQQGLSAETKIIDLPVYETVLEENVEPTGADILVFTSPSNVEAYFVDNLLSRNKSDSHRQIYRQKVRRNGCKLQAALLPDEIGLAEAVFGI